MSAVLLRQQAKLQRKRKHGPAGGAWRCGGWRLASAGAGACPTQQAGIREPTVGHGAMRVPPSVTMKAELLVLAAATASACARVRLEAGDGDSVNFQRWGEQPVTIIATSPASSRGRFVISIAALILKGQPARSGPVPKCARSVPEEARSRGSRFSRTKRLTGSKVNDFHGSSI